MINMRFNVLPADVFGRCTLYKMLGYFSLIGLLRLHSLLGDYHQALAVLENINITKRVSSTSCALPQQQHYLVVCTVAHLYVGVSRSHHYYHVVWCSAYA